MLSFFVEKNAGVASLVWDGVTNGSSENESCCFLRALSLSSHFLCSVIAVILSFGNTGNGQFLGITQCV